MNVVTSSVGHANIHDCWNIIGVYGDQSCTELKKHIHCRNCPVYSAAAARLLDVDLTADQLDLWTHHFAQEQQEAARDTESAVLFRISQEWLALPTAIFSEIVSPRIIRPVPHRRTSVMLGLGSFRGMLVVCIALGHILGIEEAGRPKRAAEQGRWMVIQSGGGQVICPVDEVYGIERYHANALQQAPSTLTGALSHYSRAILPWQNQSVGLLDEQRLFETIDRSLASATVI